jgi:energy-coupling factor transporter ATP-binding protein EcfA2
VIRRVRVQGFKRFADETFVFPGHVVLAGPNNAGKTTVLQAIAAWGLALERWKNHNDFQKHGGGFTKVPIARQAFSAVPLRTFELLWRDRAYRGAITITVQTDQWTVPMELIADSTEQVFVRPDQEVSSSQIRAAELPVVFVPPMTGLSVEEPVYQRPKVDHLLGQAKPGEVLRNLLVEASASERAWQALQESIQRLFGFELLPPNSAGPHILAEYRVRGGPRFDIGSAGSGFQQILMLLTFLHTRPASVLLLDEPDAHLHVILQDAIYGELRSVAARQKSQLVVATHSEVIIDSVDPTELCVLLDHPRLLATNDERRRLIASLGSLTNEDILLAAETPGILYLEDYTDLLILREWARILAHPARDLLTTRLFWKKTVHQARPGAAGIQAREHFDALALVREDLPGVELLDGDANPAIPATDLTGRGLQRLRWRRYEIESYLVHPAALARFVEAQVGAGHAAEAQRGLEEGLRAQFSAMTGDFIRAPLDPPPLVENYLVTTKARTSVLPPLLDAAGLPGLPYQRYHEIAAVMQPDEIHPEVREKLDGILRAFRL